jgi:hypothetical protein
MGGVCREGKEEQGVTVDSEFLSSNNQDPLVPLLLEELGRA